MSYGVLEELRGGLIVSCQVLKEDGLDAYRYKGRKLFGKLFILAMAKAAELGGAKGLRIDGPPNLRAVKEVTRLPVIGIYKRRYPGYDVYITPTYREAEAVAKAGAEIIALDFTERPRPRGEKAEEIVKRLKNEYGVLVMADISTFKEGLRAYEAGVDLVATTLSGYTSYTRPKEGPDLELVRELASAIDVPVVAEGRIRCPEDALNALKAGAYAVVVGTAITRPHKIVESFVKKMKEF